MACYILRTLKNGSKPSPEMLRWLLEAFALDSCLLQEPSHLPRALSIGWMWVSKAFALGLQTIRRSRFQLPDTEFGGVIPCTMVEWLPKREPWAKCIRLV